MKVCDFGLSCVKEAYDPDAPPKDTVTGTAIYLVRMPSSASRPKICLLILP